MAEQRTKEIGIRKVMQAIKATLMNLVKSLNRSKIEKRNNGERTRSPVFHSPYSPKNTPPNATFFKTICLCSGAKKHFSVRVYDPLTLFKKAVIQI